MIDAPSTMLATRLHRLGEPLRIERVPTPTALPGQAIVGVRACGICHTDLHACRGDWRARPALPLTPGHEIVGDVVALGDGATSLKLGDRVGVFWLNSACGTCNYCADGWESLCPGQVNTGFGVAGGLAEFVAVRHDFAVRVPPALDPASAAPLLCAGVSAFKALRETEVRPGETLAVIGCGGVGHLATAYGRDAGLRVVAFDVKEDALELARSVGAEAYAVNDADAVRRVKREGVHAAIVAADDASAIRFAIDLVRRKGTVVLVGLPPGDASFPVFDVVVKRFTIRGSIGGTRADVAAALDIAVRAGIRPRIEIHSLSDVNDAFARLAAGRIAGRAVVRFDRSSPQHPGCSEQPGC